jgi:hypothetical protein
MKRLEKRTYFFLCTAQYADFPTAGFLHFVPCLVLAAHIAFFAVAIFPPCGFVILIKAYQKINQLQVNVLQSRSPSPPNLERFIPRESCSD